MTLDAHAIRRPSADPDPISPELVLVDPVLAERARLELPPRPPFPTPRPRTAPAAIASPMEAEAPALRPDAETVAQPRERSRFRMMLAAALVFGLGAAVGALVNVSGSSTPAAPIAVHALRTAPPPSTRPAPARRDRPRTTPAHPAARIWAPNVLGVTALVRRHGVTLVWTPPARSSHVVLFRTIAGHATTVVYRGNAHRYRDAHVRSCVSYRYTIVNHGRDGHAATGVPTSVVTACG